MIRTFLAPLLLVGAAAAPAAAQEPVVESHFPNLATVDRTTDHSSFNSSLAFSFYGDEGPDLGIRWDLGGQFLSEQGFGGYASVPVSYLSAEDDSENELGNLELGGLYLLPAGTGTDVLVRGGLVLPTGPEGFEALINLANIVPRLTDLTSAAPDATFIRLSGSPLVRQGQLFLRGDVGLDIAIDEPEGSDIDPLIRLNVAGGVDTGTVTIAGELATIGTTGDVDEDEGRFYHTIAASVGASAGTIRPYGAVIVPIDNDLTDFLDITLAVMAGIEIPIASR